jgi:hypothetical protein
MTYNEAADEVVKITKGERYITKEQFEDLSFLPNVFYEDCGLSGCGKGTWVNFYYTDSKEAIEKLDFDNDDRWEEICDVVIISE